MLADWWWVFWLSVGVNAAYLLALGTLVISHRRGKRALEELTTVLPMATTAALAWFVGYVVVGPWWALLTAPTLLAAVVVCVFVCAYMREQVARWRVARREAGK